MSIYFIFFLFAKQISSQCIDILRVDDSNGFYKTISQFGKTSITEIIDLDRDFILVNEDYYQATEKREKLPVKKTCITAKWYMNKDTIQIKGFEDTIITFRRDNWTVLLK